MNKSFAYFLEILINVFMKKVVAVLIAGSFILTSCSYYSCPTYAKKAPPATAKEAAI